MTIRLSALGTFSTGIFDEGAAEIVAHDPGTQRLFVINADANQIDVLNIADPSDPTLVTSIDLLAALGDSAGGVNSIAVSNGIVAAAVENTDETAPGLVAFLDTDGNILNTVTVGILPDMVAFTPDGSRVLTANEGQPTDTVDPQASVSIIDISNGVENATVETADFTAFDGQEDALRAEGIRIFPDKSVSEDVEPEYVAVSPDGTTAWVTLQENNAVALVDIASATVTDIVPLGLKDHSVEGNGLDASDRDDGINIQTWPVFGMFMPDTIAAYETGGETYYVTANEGDARDSDEGRIGDEEVTLDPTAFPDAATLQLEENLGRLEFSLIDGDTDGDGDFDQLQVFGSRSFTIWNSSGEIVFDSGDQFEQITALDYPLDFNSDNDENDSFDSRSDAKGPEPEGVTIGQVGDSIYAFIGLERVGGIAVYDVTEPANAEFVQYINNRDFRVEDVEASLTSEDPVGDLGPEGLAFISAEDSPTGVPLLAVGNEVSGTTTLYDVREPDYSLQILHASDLEGGVEAIDNAPNFAAVVDFLEDEVENSITLSSGDNVIPGPFFNAAGLIDDQVYNDFYNELFGLPSDAIDQTYQSLEGAAGRLDIAIMNAIGFDAASLGNHEFDAGTNALAGFIEADFGDAGLADDEAVGTLFPYLAANLDTSADSNLDPLYTSEILPNTAFQSGPEASLAGDDVPKIAPATIIEEGGEQLGVVGAVTPFLDTISSPGNTTVFGPGAGTTDMEALATILQPVIDDLTGQGIDKIIVVSHLQNIALEQELAGFLSGVDIMVAGGSETLLADREDEGRGLQPGDEAEGPYPIVTENADGEPVVIVNTADEYSYVGRLVVDFDADGVVIPGSVDPSVSGAYATTDEAVVELWSNENAFVAGTKGALVQSLTDEVSAIVEVQDGNIFGQTEVYLEGRRDIVRSQETNLGNITADANLAAAREADDSVAVSLKNGGGIRASIGSIGDNGELLPPAANPNAGKEEGEISQLDIDNTLRFNNGLSLVTVTAEQLKEVIEHGLESSFQHVGGLRLSYEPDNEEGSRVQSLALVDDNGAVTDVVVENGEIVGDAGRPIRVVTLDFLAEGGSGFPYPDFVAADPEFANVVELDGEDENGNGELDDGEDTNLNGELDGPALTDDGAATFTRTGGEQDAFAEYLAANFADTPFSQPDTPEAEDTRIQNLNERDDTVLGDTTGDTFELQILHASDLEGGVRAIDRAPNFAAIVDLLEDEVANSLTLSAGDNVIPGPFFNAALFVNDQVFNDAHNTVFGLPDDAGSQYESLEGDRGRIDISIMNVIGFDASALGNHEFDTGTDTLESIIEPDFGDTDALGDDEWIGTTFPYLSANLDFSANSDLGNLATTEIVDGSDYVIGPAESASGETTPRLAPAAIFEEGGEQIGVIGATTPLLEMISSPGTVGVSPDVNDMQALAAILQPVVDQMVADGVNKIVLVTHLQQIALEEQLITLLEDVDIVIAGGSDTLLADETDVLRPDDTADRGYPILTTNASGDPAAIVSTDGEYSYVGRLVVEFDENGVLLPDSIDAAESGAFATTDDVVSDLYGDADPFAEGSKGALTQDLVAGVDAVVSGQDGNTFGNTDVYLDGRRDSVRTEETNLGNLTADANLAQAQDVDDTVLVSLKNGGGIRAPIGGTDMDGTLLPPQANPDVGKEEGEVSQLDIVNSLRFNNGLTLLTLTAEELAAIIEHGVADSDPGNTPGRFPQVGGLRFSFDPDEPGLDAAEPGELSRVQSLEIIDEDGTVLDTVVEDGAIVGDPARDIRIVTLDFLAGGGDGYRFDEFGENRVDIEDLGLADGTATFAAAGSEQDALAEYLAANFATPAEAFAEAETDPADDTRIQNLNAQDDTDEAVLRYFNEDELFHLYTVDPTEQDAVEADDAFVFEGEAFNDFSGEPGASPVFRFVNTETGGLFYTISEEEADFVEANLPIWDSQGEAFQAFEVAASDEVSAIYRFFNEGEGAHFYTASAEERDFVIDVLPQYAFEGIAFFA
jgi:2',3'-cyclic-nucleotide 2'-phosphodiesterase (5'-nucleotidase family)